jgi:hypothetical protein
LETLLNHVTVAPRMAQIHISPAPDLDIDKNPIHDPWKLA